MEIPIFSLAFSGTLGGRKSEISLKNKDILRMPNWRNEAGSHKQDAN